MALDKNALTANLKSTFERSKTEGWAADQVAAALADAIEGFVRTADVSGVSVAVTDTGGHNIGTGAQTGAVHLK